MKFKLHHSFILYHFCASTLWPSWLVGTSALPCTDWRVAVWRFGTSCTGSLLTLNPFWRIHSVFLSLVLTRTSFTWILGTVSHRLTLEIWALSCIPLRLNFGHFESASPVATDWHFGALNLHLLGRARPRSLYIADISVKLSPVWIEIGESALVPLFCTIVQEPLALLLSSHGINPRDCIKTLLFAFYHWFRPGFRRRNSTELPLNELISP